MDKNGTSAGQHDRRKNDPARLSPIAWMTIAVLIAVFIVLGLTTIVITSRDQHATTQFTMTLCLLTFVACAIVVAVAVCTISALGRVEYIAKQNNRYLRKQHDEAEALDGLSMEEAVYDPAETAVVPLSSDLALNAQAEFSSAGQAEHTAAEPRKGLFHAVFAWKKGAAPWRRRHSSAPLEVRTVKVELQPNGQVEVQLQKTQIPEAQLQGSVLADQVQAAAQADHLQGSTLADQLQASAQIDQQVAISAVQQTAILTDQQTATSTDQPQAALTTAEADIIDVSVTETSPTAEQSVTLERTSDLELSLAEQVLLEEGMLDLDDFMDEDQDQSQNQVQTQAQDDVQSQLGDMLSQSGISAQANQAQVSLGDTQKLPRLNHTPPGVKRFVPKGADTAKTKELPVDEIRQRLYPDNPERFNRAPLPANLTEEEDTLGLSLGFLTPDHPNALSTRTTAGETMNAPASNGFGTPPTHTFSNEAADLQRCVDEIQRILDQVQGSSSTAAQVNSALQSNTPPMSERDWLLHLGECANREAEIYRVNQYFLYEEFKAAHVDSFEQLPPDRREVVLTHMPKDIRFRVSGIIHVVEDVI